MSANPCNVRTEADKQGARCGAPEPLTASDRDLLVEVRPAGLWEMPAGDMAAREGAGTLPRPGGRSPKSLTARGRSPSCDVATGDRICCGIAVRTELRRIVIQNAPHALTDHGAR